MDDCPQLISLNRACEITSLSRTMINRLRAEGSFPQAVPVGEKRIAFDRSEVADWIQTRNQFVENWVLSRLLRGNAYILKERDGRNPHAMRLFRRFHQ